MALAQQPAASLPQVQTCGHLLSWGLCLGFPIAGERAQSTGCSPGRGTSKHRTQPGAASVCQLNRVEKVSVCLGPRADVGGGCFGSHPPLGPSAYSAMGPGEAVAAFDACCCPSGECQEPMVSCLLCSPRCALEALPQGRRAHGLRGRASPKPEPAAAGCAQAQTQQHCLPGLPRHGGRAGLVGTQGASVLPVPLHQASGAWLGPRAPQGSAWVCGLGPLRVPASHSSRPGRQQGSNVWVSQPRVAPGFGLAGPAVGGVCGVNWQMEALSAPFK